MYLGAPYDFNKTSLLSIKKKIKSIMWNTYNTKKLLKMTEKKISIDKILFV